MKNIPLIIFTLCFHFSIFAQLTESEKKNFSLLEDSLKKIELKVFFSKKESAKFEANKQFLALWSNILNDPKSILFPFDSIKEVSRLLSPDKKFRIITWNLYKEDGTYSYFGFLQVNNIKITKKGLFRKEKINEYDVYPLLDRSGTVKTPENYVSDPSKWFGMLYYDIIQSSEDYYTLLGWDGNDKLTQRKFVDILSFKADGTPVFGKDVFKFPGKFAKRIMLEYASEVSISLKYNSNRKQIIFNHLAPKDPDPTLEGQYQYYGPDGSFDALIMKKDKWIYEPIVDIRKDKDKNDNAKKPDPDKQKPVYKPK